MKSINKIAKYLLAESKDVFMLHQPDFKKKGRTKILDPKEDPDTLIKTGLGDAEKKLLENLGINGWTNSNLINDLANDLGVI